MNTKVNKDKLKEKSFKFSLRVIKFINQLPNKKQYWTIGDQLLRSGTSIGANIIEAKASSSKRDFIRFFQISLKSANETEYWLLLLKESKLASNNSIDSLLDDLLNKMLEASLLTMKGKR